MTERNNPQREDLRLTLRRFCRAVELRIPGGAGEEQAALYQALCGGDYVSRARLAYTLVAGRCAGLRSYDSFALPTAPSGEPLLPIRVLPGLERTQVAIEPAAFPVRDFLLAFAVEGEAEPTALCNLEPAGMLYYRSAAANGGEEEKRALLLRPAEAAFADDGRAGFTLPPGRRILEAAAVYDDFIEILWRADEPAQNRAAADAVLQYRSRKLSTAENGDPDAPWRELWENLPRETVEEAFLLESRYLKRSKDSEWLMGETWLDPVTGSLLNLVCLPAAQASSGDKPGAVAAEESCACLDQEADFRCCVFSVGEDFAVRGSIVACDGSLRRCDCCELRETDDSTADHDAQSCWCRLLSRFNIAACGGVFAGAGSLLQVTCDGSRRALRHLASALYPKSRASIQLLPFSKAAERLEALRGDPSAYVILCCEDAPEAQLALPADCAGRVLRLRFADTENETGADRMRAEQAENLRRFVRALPPQAAVSVCCERETSVGAALAAALLRAQNRRTEEEAIWKDPRCRPNLLVYRLCCAALCGTLPEEELRTRCALCEEARKKRTREEQWSFEETRSRLLAMNYLEIRDVRSRISGWINARLERELAEKIGLTQTQWESFLQMREPESETVARAILDWVEGLSVQKRAAKDAGTKEPHDAAWLSQNVYAEIRRLRRRFRREEGRSLAEYAAADMARQYWLAKRQTQLYQEAGLTSKIWNRFFELRGYPEKNTVTQLGKALRLDETEQRYFEEKVVWKRSFRGLEKLQAQLRDYRKQKKLTADLAQRRSAVSKKAWESINKQDDRAVTSQDTLLKLIVGMVLSPEEGLTLLRTVDSAYVMERDLIVLTAIVLDVYDPHRVKALLNAFTPPGESEPYGDTLYSGEMPNEIELLPSDGKRHFIKHG